VNVHLLESDTLVEKEGCTAVNEWEVDSTAAGVETQEADNAVEVAIALAVVHSTPGDGHMQELVRLRARQVEGSIQPVRDCAAVVEIE